MDGSLPPPRLPYLSDSDGARKDNWEHMGTYDTNMTEWGGEHIEARQKGTWFRFRV